MDTNKCAYLKRAYSGRRVNKKRSRAQFKRYHGVEMSRNAAWKESGSYKCAVEKCSSIKWSTKQSNFHSLPEDEERKSIWLSILPLRKYNVINICSKHFLDKDFDPENPGSLLDTAFPFYVKPEKKLPKPRIVNNEDSPLVDPLAERTRQIKTYSRKNRPKKEKQNVAGSEIGNTQGDTGSKIGNTQEECVNNEESTLDDPLTEPTRKLITYSRKNTQKKDTQNVACSQIGNTQNVACSQIGNTQNVSGSQLGNTQAVTGSQIENSHAFTGSQIRATQADTSSQIGDTEDVTRSIKSDIEDEEDHGMESQEYGLDEAGSPGSGVTAVCAGCLSGDRKCAPVGALFEVMVKLLDLTEDDQAPATSALLCWECAASLTRARRFVQRARRAQGELRRYASDPDNTLIEPQSSLSIVTITDFNMKIVAEDPNDTMDDDYQGGGRDDDDDDIMKVKEEEEEEGSDVREVPEPSPMVQEITLQPERYTRHMRVIPAKGRSGGDGKGGGGSGGGQGALACAPCDVAFTTPAELNKHRAQEHRDMSEAPYICSVCKDNFTKDELNAHMQQHMFVFYCEVCRRDFLTEKRFRVHYARGHAQIFECGYCRVPFASQSLLARHCLSLHYKYCCAHCGRQYMARDQLERHMRIHR